MGRRTFESLPDAHRPLRERRNIVSAPTRTSARRARRCTPASTPRLQDVRRGLLRDRRSLGLRADAPARGSHLRYPRRGEPPGDVFFPALAPADWHCVQASEPMFENDLSRSSSAPMSARTEIESLYHLPAARGEEQRRYMEELEAAGICVFCPEHFAAYHREPVELSGEHWYVTRNDYPYAGTRAHYLIVPHLHVRAFEELAGCGGRGAVVAQAQAESAAASRSAVATGRAQRGHALQRGQRRAPSCSFRRAGRRSGANGALSRQPRGPESE